MAGSFRVSTTAAFNRSLRRLVKKDRGITELFEGLVDTLESDPQNTSRKHRIRKLTAVESGSVRKSV